MFVYFSPGDGDGDKVFVEMTEKMNQREGRIGEGKVLFSEEKKGKWQEVSSPLFW